MSAISNQPNSLAPKEGIDPQVLCHIKQELPATLLPSHHITHAPNAGLNPLVDSASYLFSLLGKIKQIKVYTQLSVLQIELLHEIRNFEDLAKNQGYQQEYIAVCRYLLCASFDDVISHTPWGQDEWENFSLLMAFNQDTNHQEKFFTIMERAIKDPQHYIDLMEIMYLCLVLGYKGQYRDSEHNYQQLELITNNLYQYIRSHRGNFSTRLSPSAIKPLTKPTKKKKPKKFSPFFIFLVTASVIMIIFISLGYVMDILSSQLLSPKGGIM